MKLLSSAFQDKENIPVRYTCRGHNVNPPLEISDVPVGTKSFVLIVKDTDAFPETWIHWLVYNIPASTKTIEEDSLPGGAREGMCTAGTFGYEGPCPKYFTGPHSCYFLLIALNILLDVPMNADITKVSEEIKGHVLAETKLTGIVEGTRETPTN